VLRNNNFMWFTKCKRICWFLISMEQLSRRCWLLSLTLSHLSELIARLLCGLEICIFHYRFRRSFFLSLCPCLLSAVGTKNLVLTISLKCIIRHERSCCRLLVLGTKNRIYIYFVANDYSVDENIGYQVMIEDSCQVLLDLLPYYSVPGTPEFCVPGYRTTVHTFFLDTSTQKASKQIE